MANPEFEVLKSGLLAGKKRQRGDIVTAEELNTSAAVLDALIGSRHIKPIAEQDGEKIERLEGRIDRLSEMHVEILNAISALQTEIASLKGPAPAAKPSEKKASTSTKAASEGAQAASGAKAPAKRPRAPRKPRAKKEA